jgi:hypothetical protein
MSGWAVIQSGWSVFTGGKETMLIGGITPFATIISELMPTDMFSQWDMAGRETERPRRSRAKADNIDQRCLARVQFR